MIVLYCVYINTTSAIRMYKIARQYSSVLFFLVLELLSLKALNPIMLPQPTQITKMTYPQLFLSGWTEIIISYGSH